jgi:hypothetical protein
MSRRRIDRHVVRAAVRTSQPRRGSHHAIRAGKCLDFCGNPQRISILRNWLIRSPEQAPARCSHIGTIDCLNPLGAKDTYPIIGMRKADERTQAPIAEIQLRSLLQRGERRVQTPESFKASTYRRTAAACGTFAANARFAGRLRAPAAMSRKISWNIWPWHGDLGRLYGSRTRRHRAHSASRPWFLRRSELEPRLRIIDESDRLWHVPRLAQRLPAPQRRIGSHRYPSATKLTE